MTGSKPLGRKAYGSIGHLPGSRMGPADHAVPEGQRVICCEKTRDRHDRIIVQEKLDGSCCAVAMVDGQVLALGRRGYLAETSPFEQHHLFADWVACHRGLFATLLDEGERIVGEWMAQVHGTRYNLHHWPFVAFDIMRESHRAPTAEACGRLCGELPTPSTLHDGPEPCEVAEALSLLGEYGHHGATDRAEGIVYRVERRGEVDFLAKWVRPDKVDGCYLPEVSGLPAAWNWLPEQGEP